MEIIIYPSDISIDTLITKVYRRKNRRCCCYCEGVLRGNNRTNEHFIPKDKGGPDWSSNILYCCKSCNKRKGNLMPHEFLLKMEEKERELASKMPSSTTTYKYYTTVVKNLKRLIDNF